MQELTIRIERQGRTEHSALNVQQLVIAGWTGRNQAEVEKHIAELEAIGVKRPRRTPVFYRVANARLTLKPVIEVVGEDTSGEVEFVVAAVGGEVLVGVGSDHTDRKLETVGVTVAKQVCDKPVGPTFWPMREVEAHWDKLVLRSRITRDGVEQVYQEGSVVHLLAPRELIRLHAGADQLAEGTVIFGGTLAVRGGVRAAQRFEGEVEDPVLNRRISFAYEVKQLPEDEAVS